MHKVILLFVAIAFSCCVYGQQKEIDSLENVLKVAKDDSSKVKILNKITFISIEPPADYKQAFLYAEKAQNLANKLHYKKGLAYACSNLGIIYGYYGIYQRAMENYLTALRLWEDLKDSAMIIQLYRNLSSQYTLQGKYEKALNIELMLEKICEAKNYQTIIASWEVASGYYEYCKHALQQGSSTLANNCYNKAIEYDLKTLQIAKDLKDSNWIPGLYMSIGSFYDKCNICEEAHLKEESNLIKANYYHKAEECYFKAFEIFRKSNDSNGICTCYFNLGLFYRNQGVLLTQANKFSEAKIDYQKSLDYYFKAFAIIKKLGYKHGIANYSKELGTTYLKLNKCNKAEFYLLNAASTFEELGYKEGAKETYELLSEVSLKKKDYKKALDYYKNFSGLKDSLMNEETAKQLTEAEIKYETEKKDNEIVLLNKNKQIEEGKIKQQSRNIFFIVLVAALFILSILVYIKFEQNKTALHLKQLQQKALRAQLNPHFIFNAMQSIQRAYESNNKKGEELLINFSLLMRDVLNKSFLSEVTLEEELELTMKYLKVESQRFARACNFNASIDEVINTSEVAFPSMVLQPVFENAVKYGAGNINFKH